MVTDSHRHLLLKRIIFGPFPGVQSVEYLNMLASGEGDGYRIHSVVAMVVTLGPVLDFFNMPSVHPVYIIGLSGLTVLRQIEFLHHIDKIPLLAEQFGDLAAGRHHSPDIFIQDLRGFLRYVLGVREVSVHEIGRDLGFRHQQIVVFSPGNRVPHVKEVIHKRLVFILSFLTILPDDIVDRCVTTLLTVHVREFQSLVGIGIIEHQGLRDNMLDVDAFAEQHIPRNILSGVQRLVAVRLEFLVKPVAQDVVRTDIGKVELGLEFLLDFLVLLGSRADVLGRFLTLGRVLLEASGHLDVDLIRPAIFIAHHIHHIDHLVEDLLHHRIPQSALRKHLKPVFQHPALIFLPGHRRRMVVAREAAGDIIGLPFLEVRENLSHRLVAERGIVLHEPDGSEQP